MMKKVLKFGSPVLTIALFVLAGVLLLGSSIGGARAALTYYSETYKSQINMYDIGVTLNENDEGVSNRDYEAYSDGQWDENEGVLLAKHFTEENPFQPGVVYDECISASNTGNIDEYVRITLYTYWIDKDNKKMTELSPELIELHEDAEHVGPGKDWLPDVSASTRERKVYYYNRILKQGTTTPNLTDTLTINDSILDHMTITEEPVEGGTIITATYDYDGAQFIIEAVVDAVQTHNAEDAIWSAWGRRVSIDNNGYLTLK